MLFSPSVLDRQNIFRVSLAIIFLSLSAGKFIIWSPRSENLYGIHKFIYKTLSNGLHNAIQHLLPIVLHYTFCGYIEASGSIPKFRLFSLGCPQEPQI